MKLSLRNTPCVAAVVALLSATAACTADTEDAPSETAPPTADLIEAPVTAPRGALGTATPSSAARAAMQPRVDALIDPHAQQPQGDGAGPTGAAPSSESAPPAGGTGIDKAPAAALSEERMVAAKLGLPARFLVGLGNDAEGADPAAASAYGLGTSVDIHYMYLSGLSWPDWNPNGSYVTLQANAARAHGVVPMFTLYQAAAWGEANLANFDDPAYMTLFWRGVRVMYDRLGEFDAPAIVHIEPDLWGYFQSLRGDDPANAKVRVGSLVPECVDLPENAAGFGKCVVRLARRIAPKVVVGLSASTFGAPGPNGPDGARVAAYLAAVGGAEADIVVVETLDRDAGCFENGSDPNCKRSGAFYWDENNVQHPNFHDHLAFAKAIRKGVGRPLLWWQMPLGVPASSAGTTSHYRDNRVKYLFAHPDEFVAAGGIGAVFGTGAPNQTTVRTDGGQFKNAVAGYHQAPVALP